MYNNTATLTTPLRVSLQTLALRLSLIVIVVLASCTYVDVGSIFAAGNVDDRFEKSQTSKEIELPSVLGKTTSYSFGVVTDLHYYNSRPHYLKRIQSQIDKGTLDIDFIVNLGDTSQSATEGQFQLYLEDMESLKIPIYTLIGNHDIQMEGEKLYNKYISTDTSYSFHIGNTQFIMLDTANGTLGTKQMAWYEDLLSKSKATNKLVFSHYGITSKGWQGLVSLSYQEEVYRLYSMHDTYNVDFFFNGHTHTYLTETVRGVDYVTVGAGAKPNNLAVVSVTPDNVSYKISNI